METPVYRSVLLSVKPLFDLGQILATPRAADLIASGRVPLLMILARHVSADWGDVPDAIAKANRAALESGGELISIHKFTQESEASPGTQNQSNEHIWVVTSVTSISRRTTTFMMPDETSGIAQTLI
jgi:hypothetical protein